MTLVDYNKAKLTEGTGKTYKEVSAISSVAKTAQGQSCVKTVLN